MPRTRRRKTIILLLPWLALPLAGVALTALEVWLRHQPKPQAPPGPAVVWTFEPREAGAIISSPALAEGRVHVGTIHDAGLLSRGVVYAIDEASGTPVWRFDGGGAMIHMYSSPTLAEGRLYIGEGMHANFDCKLWCLDAASGAERWRFGAGGHIESTPCVAAGRVFFGAGDDGVYALDAETGRRLWQFNQERHVDSNPAFDGGLVYVGTGVSRRFNTFEVLALDAASGTPAWRVPTELPAWGSPAVDDGRLFIGLGHGRLDRGAESPAGALLCLDAVTGRRLWERPLPDAVMGRAAVDEARVYFGCRDGHVYALDRADGGVRWKRDLGSAVVTTPALAGGRLYAVASAGRVACLGPIDGRELASFDVAEHAGCECRLWSSPAVRPDGDGHRVYFGAELRSPAGNIAALYCVRFP